LAGMNEIEYPPEPLEGEDRRSWEVRALNPWRMEMKAKMLARRGPLCARGCGRMAVDYDEPIIPRCSMRGLSLEKRRLAFASANAELTCIPCNRESAHDRDGAWRRAVERFGLEAMQIWYASLELRAPDRRFMP